MATKHFHLFFTTFLFLFVHQPLLIKSLKLESVHNLHRAQKGDIIDGVDQIKKYLKAYGYYRHDINHAFNNLFDDSLEYALKVYQKFSYLDVTGKIDSDTIKMMMTPRCAVPDNHLISNYNVTIFTWDKYDLTYSYQNVVNNFTEAELTPVFDEVFDKWANVSPFTFARAAQGTRSDIRIAFVRRDHRQIDPDVFEADTWAHAYFPDLSSPYLGMNHFNADAPYKWSLNPTSNYEVDVHSIFLHEVGHNLGLNHSGLYDAVMYPWFAGGLVTKRDLIQDDIDGLQDLYGY